MGCTNKTGKGQCANQSCFWLAATKEMKRMEFQPQSILATILSILAISIMAMSVLLPLYSLIRNIIKKKSIETDLWAIGSSFLCLFFVILVVSLLLVVYDPLNIIGGVATLIGGSLLLIIYFLISLSQIRAVRGRTKISELFPFLIRKNIDKK